MSKYLHIGSIILFFLVTIVVSAPRILAKALNVHQNLIAESGFVLGYGNGLLKDEHSNYQPVFLVYHIGFDMGKIVPHIIGNDHKYFTLYVEPQYNPVVNPAGNYEFGIGIGLEYRHPIFNNLDVYILGGSGIHYISISTNEQTRGFNFADTIGCGLYMFLTKYSAINIGFRFRHVSNGGSVQPDAGINNYFGVLGYSFFY